MTANIIEELDEIIDLDHDQNELNKYMLMDDKANL